MNCLIGALYYKYRYGGQLKYRWPTIAGPWGHWFIFKDPYCIWYSSRITKEETNLNYLQQLCFKGKYRYVKEP